LSIRYRSKHTDIETYNVIGMIPGADPVLKQEYVVHTAHLDHIGIGKPVNGDSIYNGAHDNASGVASLLEIAKLYKKTGVKPKRSILITMVSAEESGLLGSAYFASHPSIPKSSIVANVNTDMPTLIAPMLSVVPLGATHSSLLKNVQYASKVLNLDIQPDPEPEQSFFTRSDQYSFVREHIPAVHCKNGRKTDQPDFDLDAYIKRWRATYYHQPADQIDGWFRFSAAKTYIQLNFLISYSIAMEKQRPSWNNDSYF
jgi:Zn-dependent M28 family amino/carboxypeptidase